MHPLLVALAVLGSKAAALSNTDDETSLLQATLSTDRQRWFEPQVEQVQEFVTHTPHPVPQFEINLDLPPQKRFVQVAKAFKDRYLYLYQKYAGDAGSQATAKKMSISRGPENKEMQGEIDGMAKELGMPAYLLHCVQLGIPMDSARGIFLNFVDSMKMPLPPNKHYKASTSPQELLEQMSVPSFGSTGIIARDKSGTVWHARNLGFALPNYVQNFTYNALFTKGGKELYTGQMTFPALQPMTAMRRGPNGYTYQYTTRYLNSNGDSLVLAKNLYQDKRETSGWIARQVLQSTDNYEDAVKLFSTKPYPNPEYNLISGVKKGTIIARNPDGVAYKLELDDQHPFIIMENFDYVNGDKNEWLESQGQDALVQKAEEEEAKKAAAAVAALKAKAAAAAKAGGNATKDKDDKAKAGGNATKAKDDEDDVAKAKAEKALAKLKLQKVGKVSRRARAQELLEKSDDITPQVLKGVLNDKDVITDNVYFQALMNVEKDDYQSAMPQVYNCPTCEKM